MAIIGRPMKYSLILWSLPDTKLFTPATIAERARELGLVDPTDGAAHMKLQLQRIRISLGRFTHNHEFPRDGDGWVTKWGQGPTVGWFGWRWKAHAHPLDDAAYERLETALDSQSFTERAKLLRQVKRV